VIDEWLNTILPISAPDTTISLGNFFNSLCTHALGVGVVPYSTTFTNSDYIFKRNFSGNNLRARTLLGYIASAAGGYARARADGKIEIAQFSSSYATLTSGQYISAESKIYDAPVID